jgi:endonuclease/exonuclease/phosphatase family metal-dependent hydrolase
LLLVIASGCDGLEPSASGEQIQRPATTSGAALDAESSEPHPSHPENFCVHQGRPDLGAPVHRKMGGGGGFVRLPECTRLAVIENHDRWLQVAFPEIEGRTEGWLSSRYAIDCAPCRARDGGAEVSDLSWPPQPRGMCLTSGASAQEAFRVEAPPRTIEANGGARGVPGVKVLVVSYNVWELYDGQGEPAYLAKAHGGTPAEQFPRRLELLSKALAELEVDVLLLQEVEGAQVACDLASRAWPESGWTCVDSGSNTSATPQNLALATRLKGTARLLEPVNRRKSGPRGALELSLEGAGGLTVTTVHLKSSRGLQGPDDCDNARLRMGSAAALTGRYNGWSSVLIAGDFNIDPLDTSRTLYDRTVDILTARGFLRGCPLEPGCAAPTFIGSEPEHAIDLALFKSGGRWRVEAVRVLSKAPRRQQNSLGSDHLPLLIELRR